jgi:hypothetical protein
MFVAKFFERRLRLTPFGRVNCPGRFAAHRPAGSTMPRMSVVLAALIAAKVWHYWLSVALLAPIVLLMIGMGLVYVFKIKASKYPRQ